jgi:ABC-type spermidine/putrescine transport system permease subunit I
MLVGVLVFAVLLGAVFYPNAFTFVDGFFPMVSFSLETYIQLFDDPAFFEPIRNSLWMETH